MECIYCSHKTSVLNSRPQKRLMQVWRRRTCQNCGAIFTTTERAELHGSLVVRVANGKPTPFSRDTLFVSLYHSLRHRTDAITAAGALADTIIANLRKAATGATIERQAIVTTCHDVLRRFDTAAAVQYSAYHKP